MKHKKEKERELCFVIDFKKKLIGETVLKPTQVSKYECTKVYRRIIFKELGKFTL